MIDGGIVGGYYGIQAGGRGGTIGEYQGQFTATTVKQRAFDANDYIVFDNGTKLEVYLAPVDIPINSPAPTEAGALWGGLDTTITSGVSEADLTARLNNYARASALANAVNNINVTLGMKLDEGDFNIARSALDSHITSNRNGISANDADISTMMTAIQALQTAINNLPAGGGGGEGGGGDVTTAALNTAIDELKNLLETKIDQKQDSDTAATDEEVAMAVGTLRSTLQASIDTLTTQVGNIPISSDVLWATSKVFPSGSIPRASVLDTDWTLSDDAETGVAVSGDYVRIPRQFRGELHVDMEASDGSFLQRLVVPLSKGEYAGFTDPFPVQLQAEIDVDPTDSTFLRFFLEIRGNNERTIGAAAQGGRAKVYGVSALPRAQVVGITQEQLTAQLIDALIPTSVEVYPKTVKPTKAALLETLFTLEFGKVFPPISTANRVIVTFNGGVVFNGVLPAILDDMIIPLPLIDSTADNIVTNTTAQLEFYDVNVAFKLNNEPATLASRLLKIAIDRG